jgi:hypothetical protein
MSLNSDVHTRQGSWCIEVTGEAQKLLVTAHGTTGGGNNSNELGMNLWFM